MVARGIDRLRLVEARDRGEQPRDSTRWTAAAASPSDRRDWRRCPLQRIVVIGAEVASAVRPPRSKVGGGRALGSGGHLTMRQSRRWAVGPKVNPGARVRRRRSSAPPASWPARRGRGRCRRHRRWRGPPSRPSLPAGHSRETEHATDRALARRASQDRPPQRPQLAEAAQQFEVLPPVLAESEPRIDDESSHATPAAMARSSRRDSSRRMLVIRSTPGSGGPSCMSTAGTPAAATTAAISGSAVRPRTSLTRSAPAGCRGLGDNRLAGVDGDEGVRAGPDCT